MRLEVVKLIKRILYACIFFHLFVIYYNNIKRDYVNRERSGTSSEVIETNSELKNESDNIISKSKLTSTRKMQINKASNVSRGLEWQMWFSMFNGSSGRSNGDVMPRIGRR